MRMLTYCLGRNVPEPADDDKVTEQTRRQLEELLLQESQNEPMERSKLQFSSVTFYRVAVKDEVAFERPLALSQNVSKSWKSEIAHQVDASSLEKLTKLEQKCSRENFELSY